MVHKSPLPTLYENDETAWLDATAELLSSGRLDEVDFLHLAEYLADMTRSDRRKVESRLEVLLAHLLKWTHQPEKRTPSWRGTILVQRHKLARLLKSGVLRNHADEVLAEVYGEAVSVASAETEIPADRFPPECPFTVDQLLSEDLPSD